MPDDWSWFWAGESGRDNLLRDEIEGLQSRAFAASQQSARLSSQLRTLQGSLESRLQALSTAFDAYVELGDVREQLAGHPATGAVRRDTLRALDVLAAGGVPEPVAGRDAGYWLVDAVNEVVTLVAGGPPAPATGAALPPAEHETFVVAAAGWLGRGDRVATRVPGLLVGDGALAAPQVVLWRAVVHGTYGDVLDAVASAWTHDVDLSGPTWDTFARDAARASGPVETLRWLLAVLDGTWTPTAADDASRPDDRQALRGLVDALVGAGLGEERALLERARVLRARIEDPARPAPDPQAEPPRTPTTRLLQEALLDPEVPPGARASLIAWARPGLQAAAAGIAAAVAAEHPGPTVVRTEVGEVEVGPGGIEPEQLARLDGRAEQRWATPRSRLLAPGVPAAVLLVAGVALLPTRTGGLGVFLLVVAAVLGVVLGRELLRARSTRAELAAVRLRTRERVEEGRVTAGAVRTASLKTKAEVAGLARAIAADPRTDPRDAGAGRPVGSALR